jgi:hypothetical protein
MDPERRRRPMRRLWAVSAVPPDRPDIAPAVDSYAELLE